jgi:type III restriction enzyme
VKYWIRNLSGRPQTSFWLPTSTDRFYPDFVALLEGGRILVVEYKGGDRVTTDDTKEKRNIGELWVANSGGTSLFLMAEKKNAHGQELAEQLAFAVA